MIVRCAAERLNEKQAREFSIGKFRFQAGQSFDLTLGKEYIVYGLSILEGTLWVEIVSVFEYVYPVPLCLFEIVDGRVSRYWKVVLHENGNLTLWPPSFYRDYYLDYLSDGVAEVRANFRRLRDLFEEEALGEEFSPT